MKPKTPLKLIASRNQSNPRPTAGGKILDKPRIMLISRLLLNDQLWSQGDVVVIEGGRAIQLTPRLQPRGGQLLQSGDIPLTLY